MHKHLKHAAGAVLEGGLIAALAVGLIAGSALAGKPTSGSGGGGGKHGGGTTGSSSMAVVMVTDANGNGAPNWNDTITFTVTTTATASPYVSLKCTQNGTVVYSANAGFYADYPWPGSRNMPLASPAWTGGSASCTATLNDTLATLKFTVGA